MTVQLVEDTSLCFGHLKLSLDSFLQLFVTVLLDVQIVIFNVSIILSLNTQCSRLNKLVTTLLCYLFPITCVFNLFLCNSCTGASLCEMKKKYNTVWLESQSC